MATRGRKSKPTAMKELEGNPGKHPLNTSEPKPNKKAPACPKWLEPEAIRYHAAAAVPHLQDHDPDQWQPLPSNCFRRALYFPSFL